MLREYEWSPNGRCDGCRKKVEVVLGAMFNRTARGWDNWMSRARATELAREGVCPWCGQRTTTPARTLLGRFERILRAYERESCS